MSQIHPTAKPSVFIDSARTLRAFLASCVFHGFLLGTIVGFGFLYRSHLPLIQSGSAAGTSIISLETMVITSPPSPPAPPIAPPPAPQLPVAAAPALIRPAITPIPPVALPKLPDVGVPVLAAQPHVITPSKPAEAQVTVHPTISHSTSTIAISHSKPATATTISSFAPGLNLLPHPPYPTEASDRRETGVVVMNVQFDVNGDVARAEVAQSSGVPILDSETRSFIRAHWHSAAYAGQTISQPVEYALKNL